MIPVTERVLGFARPFGYAGDNGWGPARGDYE